MKTLKKRAKEQKAALHASKLKLISELRRAASTLLDIGEQQSDDLDNRDRAQLRYCAGEAFKVIGHLEEKVK